MKKCLAIILSIILLICALPVNAADSGDDQLKVLFIGNSFSDDATDGGYHSDSMLFKIMKSMLGERNVAVGLSWSGGKTMAWHASVAKTNTPEYSFFYTDSHDGWNYIGKKTSAEALEYTDWDIVVLQPYGQELTLGYSSSIDGILNEFMNLEASTPYMLDHVAKHAPQANIYLYLIWSVVTENTLNAGLDEFRTIAKNTSRAEAYVGTESGKGFAGVIPVGAAVQAARSTYLALLDYNGNAITQNNVNAASDPQIGLQRDAVHLSLNVGRYLANLTVAETLIPSSMRAGSYTLPEIRASQMVGELPFEYMDLIRLSVDAAMASVQYAGSSKYIPLRSMTEGHADAPIETLSDTLSKNAIVIGGAENKEECEAAISDAVKDISGLDITVTSKVDSYSPPAAGESVSVNADITVTHGYQTKKLSATVTAKPGHIIKAEAEAGGTLSKLGDVKAPEGEDFTFAVIPDAGYEIADVKVDGTSVGAVDSYTFEAVSKPHTITASFRVKNSFTDVESDKWYYEGILYASSRGYMNGTNKECTLFSPNMEFTREQFVQLLFNMEGLDAKAYDGNTGFTDVPEGKWYSAAVKWAKDAGVTDGIGDGKFGLGGTVSREQLAKFLMNYSVLKGQDTTAAADLSSFEDVSKVSSWAKSAVSWAVSEKLIGSTDTTKLILSPQKIATRAEIAKISMSYDAYLAK